MFEHSSTRAAHRRSPAFVTLVAAFVAVDFIVGIPAAVAADAMPLTLDDALRLAETDQPVLTGQQAAIRAAEEAKVSASQLPDPKLKLGLINVPVAGPDAFSLTSDFMTMRMVGVMQEFPRESKRRLKGELAEIDRQQKSLELATTRRSIRRDVALAWVEAWHAQRAVSVAEVLQKETERQLDSLGVALKSGKATQADVLSARIGMDLLRDRTADLARGSATARAELSRWIGAQADRPLPADQPVLPPPMSMEELMTHIQSHPHLSAYDKQVALAETEVELARKGSVPDWSVEVSYNVRGSPYADMVSVQFGIDLPIFQQNRQVRDVSNKIALADRARAMRADNLREMEAMVKRHFAEWRSALERIERYRASILPQATQRVEVALSAYRSGRGDLAAVLDARRAELDLRMQQIMLETEAAKAQVQIVFYDQQ
jgi:outer membrane protein TolC